MKILIAVCTCHARREYAEAIRQTWGKEVVGADLKFFFGNHDIIREYKCREDEIRLDVPDDYRNFPVKVQAMRDWALANGYDLVFKTDDDTYVRPERLLSSLPISHYHGRVRGPSGMKPAPYCSGFGYWVDRYAMEKLQGKAWDGDVAEDRWTANELLKEGVRPTHDPRYAVVWSKKSALNHREPPRVNNNIAVACEYSPDMMKTVHADFLTGVPATDYTKPIPYGQLSKICVMIKTFLRDGYLFATIEGLQRNFPEVKMVIADDGCETSQKITKYAALRDAGHVCVWLPYDSGFGEKANEAVKHCDRSYVLIGSDDFDFSDRAVRAGVERMVKVLDTYPDIGVASGRVDGRPYEHLLDISEGGTVIKETPGFSGHGEIEGTHFHYTDLTVNFSLIRRSVFDTVRWDGGEVKIGGGEHGAFFLDVADAGWKVVYVDGANINQLKHNPTWEAKDYRFLRGRARTSVGRPCLKKRGITKWVLTDGRVEIC